MKKVTLREAVLEDTLIAPRLREADKEELYQSGHDSALYGLSQSFLHSEKTWAILIDDVCEGLMGVSELEDGSGVLWAMTTNEAIKDKKVFRQGAALGFEKLARFNHLHNYVCGSNIVHIMWLQKMGFTIHFDNYIVPRNVPFYYFSRRIN